ncbi:MAG TPA: hypothetical protein VGN80_19045 [Devosiaceae bacterium]|jgi:hypothetical protein|nr:hypothetical protein [Devosiaceae bacterium]
MKINLAPQRRDNTLEVSKAGDVLTINDDVFDLSAIPEGATLPADAIDCEWVSGDITRVSGELELTLILPHGPKPPQHVGFPNPIIDPPDGLIILPAEEAADA